MGSKPLVVFDVDGVLASAGGTVTGQQLSALSCAWGILSSRSQARALDALQELGLVHGCPYEFIEVCRVSQRAEELRMIREKYPGFTEYVYVADRERDKAEAELAGWQFVNANDFGDHFPALKGRGG